MKRKIVGLVVVGLLACTPAQLAAWDNAINVGSAAVVPAENLACSAATELDPTGATAVCAYVDATGNAVSAGFQVVESVQAIVALLAATSPKVPATVTVLNQAKAILHVRK